MSKAFLIETIRNSVDRPVSSSCRERMDWGYRPALYAEEGMFDLKSPEQFRVEKWRIQVALVSDYTVDIHEKLMKEAERERAFKSLVYFLFDDLIRDVHELRSAIRAMDLHSSLALVNKLLNKITP